MLFHLEITIIKYKQCLLIRYIYECNNDIDEEENKCNCTLKDDSKKKTEVEEVNDDKNNGADNIKMNSGND